MSANCPESQTWHSINGALTSGGISVEQRALIKHDGDNISYAWRPYRKFSYTIFISTINVPKNKSGKSNPITDGRRGRRARSVGETAALASDRGATCKQSLHGWQVIAARLASNRGGAGISPARAASLEHTAEGVSKGGASASAVSILHHVKEPAALQSPEAKAGASDHYNSCGCWGYARGAKDFRMPLDREVY